MHRADRGATLVEAAFAIPIFFLLLLGLVDFGIVGLNDNQAGNSARDGARVGAIDYLEADVAGSADRLAIEAAIEKNLPDRRIPETATLEVECLDVVTNSTITCATAEPDEDLLHVRVYWDQDFVSPVAQALGFSSTQVDGDATVVIVGAPTAGTTPTPAPGCDVTGVTVTPSSIDRLTSGQLDGTLTIAVARTGDCDSLNVRLVDQSGASTQICAAAACASTVYDGASDSFWTLGTASVQVTGDDSVSGTFQVTGTPPPIPPCDLVITIANNPADQKNDRLQTFSGGDRQRVTVARAPASGPCPNLTVTMRPPVEATVVTLCSGLPCLGTHSYSSNATIWEVASGRTTATVTVQGTDVLETATFEVRPT